MLFYVLAISSNHAPSYIVMFIAPPPPPPASQVLDSVGSLTDSQISSATSQVTVEVHGNGHNGNEALCLEILGTLRRALTKQYNVKLSLYEVCVWVGVGWG